MGDEKDALRHLRGIHLAFVIASVAISMAILGSDSVYKTAADQLREAVRLTAALDGASIVKSISDSSGVEHSDNSLVEFLDESLSEYFLAMDMAVESVSGNTLAVVLSKEEQYGHLANLQDFDEFDEPDPDFWFKRQRCLLSDGTNTFTRLDDLNPIKADPAVSLRALSSNLDKLLKAETLYVNPVFDADFLSRGSPIEERHAKQWRLIGEALEEAESVELILRELTGVEFTDSTSRGVFKTAQGHAFDSPVAYEDYNFRFDTLTLSISARILTPEADRQSKSFEMKLPVMFEPREADFMVKALQREGFDRALYSRYVSGARTFDRLFPELANLITNLESTSAEDLERYLEEQSRSSGAPISLLGLQIRRDLIEVWGVLLMLCVQLYFCMHYRALLRRLPDNEELSFPWIGVYRDPVSTVAFLASIALPLCVCVILAFMPNEKTTLQSLEIVWLLAALALLSWATTLYVQYRRRLIST